MKLNYVIIFIIVFSTSIFSQTQENFKTDTLKNDIYRVQKVDLKNSSVLELQNQNKLDSENGSPQSEKFRVIPLPPADTSNSKFELLPNSEPKDFKARLIYKKKLQ